MGVLTGLCLKSPPLGALCLQRIEGMVALLRGRGKVLPVDTPSVLPAP